MKPRKPRRLPPRETLAAFVLLDDQEADAGDQDAATGILDDVAGNQTGQRLDAEPDVGKENHGLSPIGDIVKR